MTYRLNDKIRDLKPYEPISGQYRIRLDANESFLPLPDDIIQKIRQETACAAYNRYPDSTAGELCERFAAYHGLNTESLTAGNGSDELISVLCNAFLMKGDSILTVAPDFSMYKFYASLSEANCVEYQKKPDLTIDVDDMIRCAARHNTKLIVFSNPCNPTSLGLKREEVRRLITSVPALVVVDEAYMDFWDQSLLPEAEQYDNLIILRTCSKAFAMAGIRLGFAVANPTLTKALHAVKSPYNVNTLTQKIGALILSEPEWIQASIRKVVESRDELYRGFRQLEADVGADMHVYPTVTNFVLIRLENAKEIYDYLLKAGIAVRFLGDFLRITAGSGEENAEVLRVFADALKR
ncbi:MAG: histidinol-phosphate transaminase [Clostridiales bacterium]|nr:histidinol-phosphate transaminase [Clostridiales bacterium]